MGTFFRDPLNGGVPKETEGLTLIKAIIIINYNLFIITLT